MHRFILNDTNFLRCSQRFNLKNASASNIKLTTSHTGPTSAHQRHRTKNIYKLKYKYTYRSSLLYSKASAKGFGFALSILYNIQTHTQPYFFFTIYSFLLYNLNIMLQCVYCHRCRRRFRNTPNSCVWSPKRCGRA